MILRIDARISSMLGSGVLSALCIPHPHCSTVLARPKPRAQPATHDKDFGTPIARLHQCIGFIEIVRFVRLSDASNATPQWHEPAAVHVAGLGSMRLSVS